MKTSFLILLLVGISSSYAKPTITQAPAPTMKDGVRMLLESSEQYQTWANMVLDTAEEDLNAQSVAKLMTDGADASQNLHETVQKVNDMMVKAGKDGAPQGFHAGVAKAAVEMLKEEAGTEDLTQDDKLALIAGDKISADTLRLRINLRLIARSLEVMDGTVAELEGLLADEVTDADILEVLEEFVEDLSGESTALMLVFKAISETFEDAAVELLELVELDMKNLKEDDDDKTTDAPTQDDNTQSRKRRSPRRTGSTFGSRSGSSFGSRSGSTFGSRSSSFGSSGSRRSGFSRDLGRGWSVGTGGLSWSNRRGNVHFNAKPTFGGGGIGASAGIRIEF